MSNVDFSFISRLEGGQQLNGYVPDASGSQSGVTIATGFDLGARNARDLTNLGLPASLVNKLSPYCGKTRFVAEQYLIRNPLRVTAEEAGLIDAASKRSAINTLISRYDRAIGNSGRMRFEQLPGDAQTVIASVAFQYGDLASRCPKFWKTVTEQRWESAITELRNFGDAYGPRRRTEADRLSRVLGSPRPSGNTPSQTPTPSTPAPSTPRSGQQTPPSQTISAAVGKGGKNNAADVRLIQTLLGPRLPAGARPLPVNGRADQNLIDAITTFQRAVVGMPSPDGRIDPGKKTFQALTGQAVPPAPRSPPSTPRSSPPPSNPQPTTNSSPPLPGLGQWSQPAPTTLTDSVGQGGKNNAADVRMIQALMNAHLPVPMAPLPVNGRCDQHLISAITHYQRQEMGMSKPDGRIDPGGRTFQSLTGASSPPTRNPTAPTPPANQPRPSSNQSSDLLAATRDFSFPFPRAPGASYKSGGRQFGANRSGGRKHGGCDLLFPVGTWIHAIADGTVIRDPYYFYSGTYALEVRHGNLVVRYGEIKPGSFVGGTRVTKGQRLCQVGRLDSGSSMLHIELYRGTAQGGLTANNPPYKRRSDLLDPTPFLDQWLRNLPRS